MMADNDAGEAAGIYEFDAPCHAVDFKELLEAETDESWFERRAEGADPHLVTPQRSSAMRVEKPKRDEKSGTHSLHTQKEMASGQNSSASPPSNVVTSWGQERQRVVRPKRLGIPAQPRRVSKRKGTSSSSEPPLKKQKEIPAAPKPRDETPVSRRSERRSSKKSRKAPEATSAASEPVTSEQLEMERIRSLQNEVAQQRRRNEASYKAALAGRPPPKKLVLANTVPQDFTFSTDARVKASSNPVQKEVDFVQQLRKPSSPAKARRGATIPKPFNFSGGHKKVQEREDYVPMAQQVELFQRRTPTRYHLRSSRSLERGPSSVKSQHLKLTKPHSPHLITRERSRPVHVKSSAELEAEELEKIQKVKIKPLELNKKILEGAEELRRPAVKEPTVAEGFQLEIERRLQERQMTRNPQNEEEPYTFRAKPLPKKVLEEVVGIPLKSIPPPTVPESPAFALKKRVRLDRKVEEVKPPSPVKVRAVPHYGIPFQPQLPENHHVEVCPFSFEQREKERQALKEKKLEKLRNEQVPQFKAQLLPDFRAVVLPEKKQLEPTKPEPFKLLLDERGSVKHSRWEQMVKDEQKQQEEAAMFKARPNTVTHKEPFRPKKDVQPGTDIDSSTVVEPFTLATERRAQEWQEYERLIAEKEALRARMEAEQRQEEEQKQREEIARLRQEQVHKAQPIRHYKPVQLKKSEIPLTVPESPNFSDRFRV
uniref:TPX2, microtubule-associated, homolog n=1 Tax=Nothobranchius rachovii TaxID=451742 RepID=A0A1A8Q9Q3_9TELE